jgi:tetratricopeptide (TPR) repeat protein
MQHEVAHIRLWGDVFSGRPRPQVCEMRRICAMNPERCFKSVEKAGAIDTKAVKSFDLARRSSDLVQKTEKILKEIPEIEKQQKIFDRDQINNRDMETYQKLEGIYTYLGNEKKQAESRKLQLEEDLKNLREKYTVLGQEKKDLELAKQALEQELSIKRAIDKNAQNLLESLKRSKELINNNISYKDISNIGGLNKSLQTLDEAINYRLKSGDGQKGNEKVEQGPAKEGSNLNQSDHSQDIAQLKEKFQHLNEIDALLKACERHRVPQIDNISQFIKTEI